MTKNHNEKLYSCEHCSEEGSYLVTHSRMVGYPEYKATYVSIFSCESHIPHSLTSLTNDFGLPKDKFEQIKIEAVIKDEQDELE